jgi:hypothetical protein
MYGVASVDSDTQITLSAPYAGTTASGVVYAIGTGFTVPDNFPEMSQGDIETATIFTRAMRKIQSKFSALVSDISGKAAISGQTFTGDIAAPKITASTGVLFGTDTAAANTLDDYEEGTWTPACTAFTIEDIRSARYTKIGNQVALQMWIQIASGSGSSGDVVITGLPFVCADDGFSVGAVNLGAANPTATNPHFRTVQNTSIMEFLKDNSTSMVGTEADAAQIITTVVYPTDS